MLTTHREWRIANMDRAAARALAEAADIPLIAAHLLILRGIDTPEAAQAYLQPRLSQLCDPFSFTDMDKAVARIEGAREKQERVLVFGDYDVDGISASCVMINGLRRFGIESIDYGMPQRLTEGYGLNAARVEDAHEQGVSLIITVDNGVAAHDAARRARELGVDLIVTDHHAIEQGLPEALAVVNPKREAPDHPGYAICGAGVAFFLCYALNGTPNDLDIAALGTVADLVPLQGQNRIIVALGLRHMAKHRRTGIDRLAAAAGISLEAVSAENIGFQLGPRINAAGRLDDGVRALELLLSECPKLATEIAKTLNEANEERRALERGIYEEIVEEIDTCWNVSERASIVMGRESWHAGVIGIVASRLQHRYHRPVVLAAFDAAGLGRGSARAGEGFDLIGAFTVCQEHFIQYGGHRAAAGCSIRQEHFEAFQAAFEREARQQLGDTIAPPPLYVDVLANLDQIDPALVNSLQDLEPIGQGNRAPLFASMSVEVVPQSIRILKEQHLKLSVRQNGKVISAIGFGMAERFYTEEMPGKIDIAYTPQFNTFRNETTVQLLLRDYRPA